MQYVYSEFHWWFMESVLKFLICLPTCNHSCFFYINKRTHPVLFSPKTLFFGVIILGYHLMVWLMCLLILIIIIITIISWDSYCMSQSLKGIITHILLLIIPVHLCRYECFHFYLVCYFELLSFQLWPVMFIIREQLPFYLLIFNIQIWLNLNCSVILSSVVCFYWCLLCNCFTVSGLYY